jgi:hypothetical protein
MGAALVSGQRDPTGPAVAASRMQDKVVRSEVNKHNNSSCNIEVAISLRKRFLPSRNLGYLLCSPTALCKSGKSLDCSINAFTRPIAFNPFTRHYLNQFRISSWK